MIESRKEKILRIMTPDRVMILLMVLMFAERIGTMFSLGLDYVSTGDTETYIYSGIRFAQTGVITIRNEYPTALIMPGMPVLVGLLTYVFGTGDFLWHIGLRLVWYVIGVATAWFVYKAVSLKVPAWYGILAALAWFAPNRAWSNNVLMTETPYCLFFYMAIYFGVLLGQKNSRKALIGFVLSLFLAFMFRAVAISLIPVFVIYWWLLEKQKFRVVLKNTAVLVAALMLFIVPWTIRNYIYFDAFIPISYGSGHPSYLGTFQGEGYPEENEEDYEKYVYPEVREKYAEYFDEDGNVKDPVCEQYITQETWAAKANYRLKVWAQNDLGSLLKSYLLIKPRWMLNWVWCWDEVFGIDRDLLHTLAQVNLVLTALAAIPAVWHRKTRSFSLFLLITYVGAIYEHALSFASDRYSANIIPLRYMVIALGLWAVVDLWKNRRAKRSAKVDTLPASL